MAELRKDLPPLPDRIKLLPVDERGYPVPKFVEWLDGKPDFRVMSANHLRACVRERLCWLCGQRLGKYLTFVIGPMCAINRVSAEPPSHTECARFAAHSCPFLTLPKAKRREAGLEGLQVQQPAGVMIERNPGVTLLWTCHSYKLIHDPRARGTVRILFEIGNPHTVEWFAHGREATRAEVEESIASGLPLLQQMAEEEGQHAVAALHLAHHRALQYLPA